MSNLGSRVRRFANDLSQANRITSDPKSLFMVTNILLYFLHAIWWPEYTLPLKQLLIDDFATVAKESRFWLSKANLGYWRCDVIFVDCFCTWKLEQRRSSLVNSPREYRFLIILFKSPQITIAVQSLQCRHNGDDDVSNNQPHDCLLNRLFRCRSKKTSKLRFTGHCEGNSPVTGEFLAQRASNTENVSIWWRHRGEKMVELVDFSI